MEAQLKELVAIFGPTGGVLLWLLIQSFRGKKDAADPLQDLAEEMRAQGREVHRELAEAREEHRREAADLRRELAAVRENLAGVKSFVEVLRERGK